MVVEWKNQFGTGRQTDNKNGQEWPMTCRHPRTDTYEKERCFLFNARLKQHMIWLVFPMQGGQARMAVVTISAWNWALYY